MTIRREKRILRLDKINLWVDHVWKSYQCRHRRSQASQHFSTKRTELLRASLNIQASSRALSSTISELTPPVI
jgi:hypothetical protein